MGWVATPAVRVVGSLDPGTYSDFTIRATQNRLGFHISQLKSRKHPGRLTAGSPTNHPI